MLAPLHASKVLKKSFNASLLKTQFPTHKKISTFLFFSSTKNHHYSPDSYSEIGAMLADDFSFPVIQTPVAHQFSVNPPSFWCVSSQSFSGYSCEGDDDDDDDDRGRRSAGCCSPRETEDMKGVEEKMDMLWEDFNEELQRVCSKKEGVDRSWKSGGGEAPAVVEVCCVQALEMSRRTGGGALSHKRQSVVVVMKVLKKMFLLHNSARFMRWRKPDRCYLNR